MSQFQTIETAAEAIANQDLSTKKNSRSARIVNVRLKTIHPAEATSSKVHNTKVQSGVDDW